MNDLILNEIDTRLRSEFKAYTGYTKFDDIITWHGITEAEAAPVVAAVEAEAETLALNAARAEAVAQILAALAAFPGQVFNAGPEKLAIYERKQALVNSWSGEGIPSKPQVEWEGDWSQRAEFTANGWVAAEALGRKFKCASAGDLWATWELNTALSNYLDEQSEPLRTRAQADIAAATDAAAVQAVAAQFAAALAALPTAFVSTAAPGLIAASGLTMLD